MRMHAFSLIAGGTRLEDSGCEAARRQRSASQPTGRRWHRRTPSAPDHDDPGRLRLLHGASMRATRTLPALLIALSLSSACFGTKHISELRARPTHYENRTVSIDGQVTRVWSIPLAPMQFYSVDDGTGNIVVVSNGSRQPRQGDHVHV